MKTGIVISAVSALVSSALCAADPYVGYIYPSGIRAGETNRLVIGGQNLNRIRGARFSLGGLEVLKVENVPGFPNPTGPQKKHLAKWLDGIAAGNMEEPPLPENPHLEEWRSNTWWRALGTLDAGQLAIVESDLYTPKNALQATTAQPESPRRVRSPSPPRPMSPSRCSPRRTVPRRSRPRLRFPQAAK